MFRLALIAAIVLQPLPAIAASVDDRPLQDRVCDELARSPSALDECLSMAFPTPMALCIEAEESQSDMESAIVACFMKKD